MNNKQKIFALVISSLHLITFCAKSNKGMSDRSFMQATERFKIYAQTIDPKKANFEHEKSKKEMKDFIELKKSPLLNKNQNEKLSEYDSLLRKKFPQDEEQLVAQGLISPIKKQKRITPESGSGSLPSFAIPQKAEKEKKLPSSSKLALDQSAASEADSKHDAASTLDQSAQSDSDLDFLQH